MIALPVPGPACPQCGEEMQYKTRLMGPGMRWSRPGAERMLVIRSAVMGNPFHFLWAAA